MKKLKLNIVIVILVLLLLSLPVFASDQWDTHVSKDEMTGTEEWYASSPVIDPVDKMDFPYGDIEAWLGIGNDGEKEWVYIGFSKAPNLTNTSTEDGYSLIRTRIKWDDKMENVRLTQDWGSKFVHFSNDKAVISKIEKSNAVLLELNWYGEGKVYFRFPLDGSSAAISKIRSAFENQ
jgi:hypothetical protein